MRPELKERILAYNRVLEANREKARDMETLAAALGRLPPGQLKKLLTDEVIAILEKYGISFE